MKLVKPGQFPFMGPKKNGVSPNIRIGTKHLGKPGVYQDPNTGYVAQNRKRFVVQNPDLPKNKVTVSLVPNEGKTLIMVEVWATHGSGNKSTMATIDPGECENAQDVKRKVAIAGGACAEHLCEAFGDELDPDLCAKYALEMLEEVIGKSAYLTK